MASRPHRTTRVLLVDDHVVVREGLRELLDAEPDFEVCDEASSGEQAVRKALDRGPDIVLLDLSLPELDGIEACKRIRRERQDIQFVTLTMYDDAATVSRALRAGIRGYVLKGSDFAHVSKGLREVAAGRVYLDSRVSEYVVTGYLRGDEPAEDDRLTDREREVVKLLADGLTSREAAIRLGLEPKTVQNYRSTAMDKLGVRTTAGLVRYAIREGLVRV